jgi:HD superfamily phosphohydrolase
MKLRSKRSKQGKPVSAPLAMVIDSGGGEVAPVCALRCRAAVSKRKTVLGDNLDVPVPDAEQHNCARKKQKQAVRASSLKDPVPVVEVHSGDVNATEASNVHSPSVVQKTTRAAHKTVVLEDVVVPISVLPNEHKKRVVRILTYMVTLTARQWAIVDTPHFQATKHEAQLGATRFVYPSAVNTRFEHMILTCYFATMMMRNLQAAQPELAITEDMIELVGTAALTHDIGHIMFSHLGDYQLIPRFKRVPPAYREHETRGVELLAWMVKHYNIAYSPEQVRLIQHLITGDVLPGYPAWLFEIVNNKRNTLDVDKMAYLSGDLYSVGKPRDLQIEHILSHARMIRNQICYPRKLHNIINEIFITRQTNFQETYRHKKLGEIEAILICVFEHMAKALDWEELFVNPEADGHAWRLVLTDAEFYSLPGKVKNPAEFKRYSLEQQQELTKAYALYRRLEERKWFKLLQAPQLLLLEEDESPEQHAEQPLAKADDLIETANRHLASTKAMAPATVATERKRKRASSEEEAEGREAAADADTSLTSDIADGVSHEEQDVPLEEDEHHNKKFRRSLDGTQLLPSECIALPPPIARQVTEPSTFTFEYVIGYSNNPNKNPIDAVTMFTVSEDGQSYILQSLRTVLEAENGTNPCYRRHQMVISKEDA